jgi:hypothetical protein
MTSRLRFAVGVAYKILGISALFSILFLMGCKTKDEPSAIFFIATTSLPTGAVSTGGGTYTASLQADGGIAPYTWELVVFVVVPIPTNALPPGLTLSPSGVISGMPTAAGTYNFVVEVQDSGGLTETTTESITITAPLSIGTSSTTLTNVGTVGSVYPPTSLAVTGGIGAITCTINSGSLPSGLSLTNATSAWAISGTIASTVTPGPYTFTIKCTDAQNDVLISGTITLTVNAAVPGLAPDGSSMNISNEPCGSGNEAILSGQYAFLVRGASASNSYNAVIGSFTANGSGEITGGLMDLNGTAGPTTGLTINSTGSSYSVGADNRGCLTLENSNGSTLTFRIALGTMSGSPSTATQGNITASASEAGQGFRGVGALMQQNSSAFNLSALKGTYVFGREGIDSDGGRYVAAGVSTADGAGDLSNISSDSDDAFAGAVNQPGPYSGIYSVAPNGRGVLTTTVGGQTIDHVVYIVSASEYLSMSTDVVDSTHPIQSGENKLQTTVAFPAHLTEGSDYAFYTTGIDTSSGGSTVSLGQATFTSSIGNTTLTLDVNDNGTEMAETNGPAVFTIAPNGRMTGSGSGFGTNPYPPIIYLVDGTQGFIVGTDPVDSSGYFQQQTGGPFNTASLSGQIFFGGRAPAAGSPFDSGTFNFDSSSSTITGVDDGSSQDFVTGTGTPLPYSFAATPSFTPTAPGQGLFGNHILAYIVSVSPAKVILMQIGATPQNPTSNRPELYVGRQ